MSKPSLSINSHSTIRDDNYDQCCADTAKYGPLRVDLSLCVFEILRKLNVQHGLDAGSLMGAYRDGKMLPHDDDFDVWLYCDSVTHNDQHADKTALLRRLARKIRPHLDQRTSVRVVSSYCYKLEIYRPEYGNYPFRDNNYHNVTVDVTLILPIDRNGNVLQYQHTGIDHRQHTLQNLLPTRLIEYEGNLYAAPASVAGYLTEMYDYIGPNAYFDKKERIYKPKAALKEA